MSDIPGLPSDIVASRGEGARLPASYVNYVVTNGGIIMPGFREPEADAR